jgi:hypothetical protein
VWRKNPVVWNEKLKLFSRLFVRLKAIDTAGGMTLYVEKSLSLVLPLAMDILIWLSKNVQDANGLVAIVEPHQVESWGLIPNFSSFLAGISLHRKTIARILDTAVSNHVGFHSICLFAMSSIVVIQGGVFACRCRTS